MENDVYQQDEKDKQHRHPGEHHSEAAYAAAELRLRRPHCQTIRNLTAGGIFSGADNDGGTNPRLNCRAQENAVARVCDGVLRSEEHTSELQSLRHLVCRLLL